MKGYLGLRIETVSFVLDCTEGLDGLTPASDGRVTEQVRSQGKQ